MEAAAGRALAFHAHSYRSLKSILEKGLDQMVLDVRPEAMPQLSHANVRGALYFTDEGSGH